MVVASRQGGGLNVSVNGRMYQTSLTDRYSSNVQNAVQEISISSTINPEKYVIFFCTFNFFKFSNFNAQFILCVDD